MCVLYVKAFYQYAPSECWELSVDFGETTSCNFPEVRGWGGSFIYRSVTSVRRIFNYARIDLSL